MLALFVNCCCKNEKQSYKISITNCWKQYNDDDYIADGLFMYKYVTAAYFNENEIASFSTSPFYVYPPSYGLYGYRDDNGNPVAPYQEYSDYYDPETDTLEGKIQSLYSSINEYLSRNDIQPPSSGISVDLPKKQSDENEGQSDRFEGDFSDFMNYNLKSDISDEIEKSDEIAKNEDEDYRFSEDKTIYIINF